MSLAPYVRILARGQGRARGFTRAEARAAMTLMLEAEADSAAIGAILMLLRMKGETAGEIAGFAEAARQALPAWSGPRPALDWPSYAAGRTRGLPWFLLSARLVAEAGYPVLLHGWNSHQRDAASLRAALGPLSIPVADTPSAASRALGEKRIAYLPLEKLSPPLMALLGLRDLLGLRSCINTVLRMLNPAGARAAVQGVFHPPYRTLQADAAGLLGLADLTVLKGGGGEFEHHPAKDIEVFGLRAGAPWQGRTGQRLDAHRRLADASDAPNALVDLWSGRRRDPFAEAIVLSTADLALETLGAPVEARSLWQQRRPLPAQPSEEGAMS
ncbi:Anthranilate phosphoribosyltransferase [Roseivivax lentus]|uniref:Anthranilate phosphoribosyltransferase n=1 Tax=Roseivivax lentus TaxID=633194 RepID=A0A1N7KSY0_9RHOB|nr:glycosyl transferase family protein [Roseivivax lentus]SIS64540.1 Anthranilate phosphoribosyltransferase [Roseivivax lentus]